MHLRMHIYLYSKTSLTDHLHRLTTPLYRTLYLDPKQHPYNTIEMVYQLPKPFTSLNGPIQIGPIVGRFRKSVTVYVPIYIYTYVHICIHSYILLYANAPKPIHIPMHTPNTYAHEDIHTFPHLHISTHTQIIYACMYIHTYAYSHIPIHPHTHTYAYIYTHTQTHLHSHTPIQTLTHIIYHSW